MQRRDYVFLSSTLAIARADLIKAACTRPPLATGDVMLVAFDYAVRRLGMALKHDNGAFDLGRYLDDVGVVPVPLDSLGRSLLG